MLVGCADVAYESEPVEGAALELRAAPTVELPDGILQGTASRDTCKLSRWGALVTSGHR